MPEQREVTFQAENASALRVHVWNNDGPLHKMGIRDGDVIVAVQGRQFEQAERLRDDVRRMQTLAMTWNQSLRLNIVPGPPVTYFVSCVSGAATPPCNGVNAVSDPARAGPFQAELPAQFDAYLWFDETRAVTPLTPPVTRCASK